MDGTAVDRIAGGFYFFLLVEFEKISDLKVKQQLWSVLQRFRQMTGIDCVRLFQISDRPGNLKNPVKSSGRELQLAHGCLH